ncbi:MAG: tetratricopeptide repeat protein [Deltaproteobacteria bacterium]|nr:tetratricopeptide repeat protein [Deltaproteobacteria bacterium]
MRVLVGIVAAGWCLLLSGPGNAGVIWQDLSGRRASETSNRQDFRQLLALFEKARHGQVWDRKALAVVAARTKSAVMDHRRDMSLWCLYGVVLYVMRRYEPATRALLTCRRLQPNGHANADLAFRLAICYTKRLDLIHAVAEYRRSLKALSDPRQLVGVQTNMAETLMGIGRLAEAIVWYRKSLRVRPGNAGALWGLAVALDRDGQADIARRVARGALRRDPKLGSLIGPDVFFVPNGEVEYYLALAHEAAGRRVEALRHFRLFLKKVSTSPWRLRAAEHIKELVGRRGHVANRAGLHRRVHRRR